MYWSAASSCFQNSRGGGADIITGERRFYTPGLDGIAGDASGPPSRLGIRAPRELCADNTTER